MSLLWLLACSTPTPPPVDLAAELGGVVVYSGRPQELVAPLWEKARAEKQVTVRPEYAESGALAARVVNEGAWGFADLIFLQEAAHFETIGAALEPLPADVLSAVAPQLRDPEGLWVGTSARLRVMVFRPDRVPAPPSTLAELSGPAWRGRVGWVASNSSLHAHLGLLKVAWGPVEAHRWVGDLVSGGVRSFPKNAALVQAVADGGVDLGLTNHTYLPAMRLAGVAQASFATPGDAGNVLMLSGVALRQGAAHREAALELLRWMVSPEVQTWTAATTWEYPARADVPLPAGLTPLPTELLYRGDLAGLTDAEASGRLLEHLGQR